MAKCVRNEIEYLEVVKYLHSIGAECSINAMDYASRYGHLEIVIYLHSIGAECTVDAMDCAMDFASLNGHLEVVKYLHSIGADWYSRCNGLGK